MAIFNNPPFFVWRILRLQILSSNLMGHTLIATDLPTESGRAITRV